MPYLLLEFQHHDVEVQVKLAYIVLLGLIHAMQSDGPHPQVL